MIYRPLISRTLFVLALLAGTLTLSAQEANLDAGKALFQQNCGACHNRNMKDNLTGPALGGVQERWADYPEEDLHAWIRNSQAMIDDGHPKATELWNQWKPTQMTAFPSLTDEDINNVLAYINYVYTGADKKVAGDSGLPVPEPIESDNTGLYILLAVILGILALVLARIISNLNYMVQVREGNAPEHRRTLVEILTSKGVIAFVIFALVVLGGYTTVNNAIKLGRQQGYQPEQPIKFSHAQHAGIQKIDCQYCHDGARRSKHSVIPATNTCMNCHKAVKKGTTYGTAEISKIFASIGYDPNKDVYIENYDEMSTDDIKKIFSSWIANNYLQEEGANVDRAESVVEEQWEGIVEALTNKELGDDRIQGPINWVRIHNLPDHVYFNHSQHVAVGKLECQTCHGPIEEMEKIYQYSPLSMGWCINCHRETSVQFQDNEYYKSYERYHEELQNGTRDKVTVEDIGGLECQKCHY
ncbi:MAG: c-type cytochrome [Saprospiraceae bacterium]